MRISSVMQPAVILRMLSQNMLVIRFPEGFVCQLKLAEDIPASDYASYKDTSPLAPLACEVGLGTYSVTEYAFVRSSVRFTPPPFVKPWSFKSGRRVGALA